MDENTRTAGPRISRSTPIKLLCALGRAFINTLVIIISVLAAIACFALLPPAELIRRAALPIARQVLKHPALDLGYLEIHPLSGMEIRNVYLGPPAGYQMPLFTLDRVFVQYDLRGLLRGKVRVMRVLVDNPRASVETRHNKLGWIAFLEALPPSEPKPKSEPSDLRILIDEVAIRGIGVSVDDGVRKIRLNGLNVFVAGLLHKEESQFNVRVRLDSDVASQANLLFSQTAKPPMDAALALRLNFDVQSRGLEKPTADVNVLFDVATKKLQSPWPLPPLTLQLKLRANADLAQDQARVDEFSFLFNGEQLAHLKSSVSGLQTSQQLELLVEKFHLPLDKIAPYARLFQPGVDFGGDIALEDVALSSTAAKLTAQSLPLLRAHLMVRDVWAKISLPPPKPGAPPLKARLSKINGRLALVTREAVAGSYSDPRMIQAALPSLTARPEAVTLSTKMGPVAPVAVHGLVKLGEVAAADAVVRGLDFRLAAGLDLAALKPRVFAAALALKLPSVQYTNPQVGTVNLSLQTSLGAHGDLLKKNVTLQQLDFNLSDLIKAQVTAQAEKFGDQSFKAQVRVQPIDIAALLDFIPAKMRAQIKPPPVKGKIGLTLKAQGKKPAPGTLPFSLPVSLDAELALQKISLHDKKLAIDLGSLDGRLTAKGPPANLTLAGQVELRDIGKPDQHLTLDRLTTELTAHIKPTSLAAQMGLTLGRVNKSDQGLTVNGLRMASQLAVKLPLPKIAANKPASVQEAHLSLDGNLAEVNLAQAGNNVKVQGLRLKSDVLYDPRREKSVSVRGQMDIAAIAHAQQQAKLDGLRLKLDTSVDGILASLPKPAVNPKNADARLEVSLDKLTKQGVLDVPLRKNSIVLEGGMRQATDVFLKELRVRLPSRGIAIDATAQVPGALTISDKNVLPVFELKAQAALDNPPATEQSKATFLFPGIQAGGRVGMAVELKHASGPGIDFTGRLFAKSFSLWAANRGVQKQKNGDQLDKESLLELRDFSADVPLKQRVLVTGKKVTLPAPKFSIFEDQAQSNLYSALRQYTAGKNNFSIGGLIMHENIRAQNAAGRELSRVRRHIKIDKVSLDLAINDSTFLLNRMYVKMLGGDIAGAMQAQLLSLKPLDVRLKLNTQVTGLNVGYLDQDNQTPTEKTEISALLDTKYEMAKQLLEGRIEITRLSLDMLDSMLGYLDPNKVNENVQSNRKLLNAWYTKRINPRVKLVSMWINHGNLNMDIEMEAWFVVGKILQNVLKNMQIRRLNILPFLPKPPAAAK